MRIVFVLILIATVPALSQADFTTQELIDIYLSNKEEAIKFIEVKGYSKGSATQFRLLCDKQKGENCKVFSKGSSVVGLTSDRNRISAITYLDSIKVFGDLLHELQHSGLDSVNVARPYYEVYTKRKLDYFIWYEIFDIEKKDRAMFSIMTKNKGTDILYKPKKK